MTSRPFGSVYFSKASLGMSAAAAGRCCARGVGAIARIETRTAKYQCLARSVVIVSPLVTLHTTTAGTGVQTFGTARGFAPKAGGLDGQQMTHPARPAHPSRPGRQD